MPAAFSLTGLNRTGRRRPAGRIKLADLTVARAGGVVALVADAAAPQQADVEAEGASAADVEASEGAVVEAEAEVGEVVAAAEDAVTTRTRDRATLFNSHRRSRMCSIT